MLFICYGETPLVNRGPQSSFLYIDKRPHQTLFTYFNYCSANNSFHSIRLILCFSKTGEIDKLTESLGQSILLVLCACSRFLFTPSNFLAPLLLVNQQHLQKRLPSPTGRLNLGFLLRENLLPCSS